MELCANTSVLSPPRVIKLCTIVNVDESILNQDVRLSLHARKEMLIKIHNTSEAITVAEILLKNGIDSVKIYSEESIVRAHTREVEEHNATLLKSNSSYIKTNQEQANKIETLLNEAKTSKTVIAKLKEKLKIEKEAISSQAHRNQELSTILNELKNERIDAINQCNIAKKENEILIKENQSLEREKRELHKKLEESDDEHAFEIKILEDRVHDLKSKDKIPESPLSNNVVFLIDENDLVYGFFPYVQYGEDSYPMIYWSERNKGLLQTRTTEVDSRKDRVATKEEYQELFDILQKEGYNLTILDKIP